MPRSISPALVSNRAGKVLRIRNAPNPTNIVALIELRLRFKNLVTISVHVLHLVRACTSHCSVVPPLFDFRGLGRGIPRQYLRFIGAEGNPKP